MMYKKQKYFCIKNIPMIVNDPDYISIHSTDSSISFIKDFEGYKSVAVRISPNGRMAFRTMYPLRKAQLNNYLQNGRAWKVSKTN